MKPQFTVFLALGVLMLSLTSCMKYEEVEFNGITDYNVKSIGLKGITVELDALIKNPNNYKISVVNYDLNLFLDGKALGKAKIKEKLILPKKSEEEHRITVSADGGQLLKLGLPAIMAMSQGGAMNVRIEGSIKAKAKGVKKSFPVDFSQMIDPAG